jgi:hypothetical protein
VCFFLYGERVLAPAAAGQPTFEHAGKIRGGAVAGAYAGKLGREPRDLERIYGLPLLGVVPQSTVLAQHTDSADAARQALPDAEAEVFRMMLAQRRGRLGRRRARTHARRRVAGA